MNEKESTNHIKVHDTKMFSSSNVLKLDAVSTMSYVFVEMKSLFLILKCSNSKDWICLKNSKQYRILQIVLLMYIM